MKLTFPASVRAALAVPLAAYAAGSLAAIAGAAVGHCFVPLARVHPAASRDDFASGFAAWDGRWYARIVDEGYAYDPRRESSVAFFPTYPLLAALVRRATRMPTVWALLAVSHGSLLAALVLLAAYARGRFADRRHPLGSIACLAMGMFPTTFYFRMAYSESTFLALAILAMLGMQRRWPAIWIALMIGAATATRAVGVALLVPFAMYLWELAKGEQFTSALWRWPVSMARLVLLVGLSCWGILAYMAYLEWRFDEPFAFVQAQSHWHQTVVHHDYLLGRAARLLTFSPARDVYDSGSRCYWALYPPKHAALSMLFANPIYFGLSATLVLWGAKKRWLNAREAAFSLALLLIPYVLKGDDTCMASQARFASVVFPVYLVMGRLLSSLPAAATVLLAAGSAALVSVYSALFVSWYWFW
ncbi:MAG TPA: hypothetical protein VFW87_01060 [Pirellulales bacterium]|nr:hypothetical protein [Pirellulales bacterium]